MAAAFGDRAATVRADVVIGFDLVRSGADNDHRLVDDIVSVEITDLGDFLLTAGHLPHAPPKLLGLLRSEIGRDIVFRGNQVAQLLILSLGAVRAFGSIGFLLPRPIILTVRPYSDYDVAK